MFITIIQCPTVTYGCGEGGLGGGASRKTEYRSLIFPIGIYYFIIFVAETITQTLHMGIKRDFRIHGGVLLCVVPVLNWRHTQSVHSISLFYAALFLTFTRNSYVCTSIFGKAIRLQKEAPICGNTCLRPLSVSLKIGSSFDKSWDLSKTSRFGEVCWAVGAGWRGRYKSRVNWREFKWSGWKGTGPTKLKWGEDGNGGPEGGWNSAGRQWHAGVN